MRKKLCLLTAVLLLSLSGCNTSEEEQLTSAAGSAEIPSEILEAMDAQTRKELIHQSRYIALTFDDGPRRETTELLLDGLLERGVSATFFVIGQQVEGNEDLILRMAAEGHQIGNHTYSHMRLLTAEKDTVIEEIQKTEVILENLLDKEDFWLRPPYGLIDESRAKLVETPMIYWSLDTEDWKLLDAQKVVDCVTEQISDGDIILLHDFYPSSVDAALEIIDCLQPQGYTFVTVQELFSIREVTPMEGKLYSLPDQTRPLP